MLGLENGNKSGMHGEHRIGPNPHGNPKYNVIFLFFFFWAYHAAYGIFQEISYTLFLKGSFSANFKIFH